jgi:hypothetical protein
MIQFASNPVPSEALGNKTGCSAAEEWVEHDIAGPAAGQDARK